MKPPIPAKKRGVRAQLVADLLNSTRAAPRTTEEIVDLCDCDRSTAETWLRDLTAVGILRHGPPRKAWRGRPARTWEYAL